MLSLARFVNAIPIAGGKKKLQRADYMSSIAAVARRLVVAAVGVAVVSVVHVHADTQMARQNIVDLVEQAEIIIRGDVVEVTDGIENGVPFTQVRVQIKEAIRGEVSGEYTFRQFGLLAPRAMGNGLVNYNVNPAGWATYRKDEEVVLFLWPQARKTGLRTTVGLKHGKFAIRAGGATNQGDNLGLFQDVSVDRSVLNDNDRRLLATKKGAVNAESFVSFVRRAVKDQWIQRGRMRNATR
jgi:hypothetical protein